MMRGNWSFGMLSAAVALTGLIACQGMSSHAESQSRGGEAPVQSRPSGGHRFGLSTPPPRTKGALRLATYNVLNLFDHVDDPSLSGEYDDINMATADERCRMLAEAIRAIDADIVALQEVESLEALTWFRDTYLKGAGYDHLASQDVGYYRGVECSIMSRYPITEQRVWPNASLEDVRFEGHGWSPPTPETRRRPMTFQRSPLMVTVKVNKRYELTIFVVHHKAGGRDFNHHREAEAVRVMQLVDAMRKADPSRNIIVMGDFNASPFDKSYRVYLQAGMIDAMAHRLWLGDEPEMLLYKTHESNRVLDYILLNSAAHRELVIGSQFVYGTLTPPPSYDWRNDPHPPGYASDHYPVVIELMPKDQL